MATSSRASKSAVTTISPSRSTRGSCLLASSQSCGVPRSSHPEAAADTKRRAKPGELDHRVPPGRARHSAAAELPCTPIEVDILAELARFAGQPLSHAFLTEQVWGYNSVTDATLLKGHMSSIRRKLQSAGAPDEFVRTLHGVGYSLHAAAS
ncbi:MAG: winged helix-turn-helix domain-containing protein [Dehalococcoidia bacterium]|nr:winged helix-turn-helix domain-containing protein [Dehalococcoidia bacterium]